MKVALFTELSPKVKNIELIISALEGDSKIESVTLLNPNEIIVSTNENGEEYRFGDIVVTKEIFDIVLIRGGFKHTSLTVEFINFCRSKGIKVFDNGFSTLKYLINKRADMLKMARFKIPMPKSYFFTNNEIMEKTDFSFPLVLKTINTGKGKNVYFVKNKEEISSALSELGKEVKNIVLQEYIDYEHDLRVFVTGDKVIGCMKRIPQAGDFRANFSLGGAVEPFNPSKEIIELAVKTAKSVGLMISGVDVLIDKDGKHWILEANHTPGIEGISEALGKNIAEEVVGFMLVNAY